jgi:hypothetical protein
VLTADKLEDVGVCQQQSPRKIFLRKLELQEQVPYFSTPKAVGKLYLRPCRDRAVHELLMSGYGNVITIFCSYFISDNFRPIVPVTILWLHNIN